MTVEDKQPKEKLAGEAVADNTTIFRHTAGVANRYQSHLDFHLTRVLGRSAYGGSAPGECFAATFGVKDGDFAAYTKGWHNMAQQVEAKGWDCLKRGHKISAREAFLRASVYWCATGMYASHQDPLNLMSTERNRICFKEAGKLFDPPIEPVNIPYENGRTLPGYFIRGGAPGEKRPTLMCMGGGDNYLEEVYFQSGAGAVRRGYNALIFEVPGQKATILESPDLVWRPDAEVPVGYAVDYLLTRAEVDPKRIALIGHSVGGYYSSRAAAYEKRISALIASPVIWDLQSGMLAVLGFDPKKPYPRDMESHLNPNNSTAKFLIEGDGRARFGHANTTVAEWMDYLGKFTILGIENKITCPVLNMAGEGEFTPEKFEEERRHFAMLPNPKNKFNISTAAEGGELHCGANNLLLKNQCEMDWLEEVFDFSL